MNDNRQQVVFRADGNSATGLGHLYRSAALSAMLSVSFDTRLLFRDAPLAVIEQLRSNFTSVHLLKGTIEDALEQEISSNIGTVPCIVVLDGYHFGPAVHSQLRSCSHKVVCIDDIHEHAFDVDLVINHAPIHKLVERYDLGKDTVFAGGLAFSLLRRPYLEAARLPYSELGRNRFFICFGGSDHRNVTTDLLAWLSESDYLHPVDVVLGSANKHYASVKQAADRYGGSVTIHKGVDDAAMLALYGKSRLAFLPASTTLIEALASGVPVITGYYVDNQANIYQSIRAYDIVPGIGDWNAPENLTEVVLKQLNGPTLAHLEKYRSFVDGYSDINLLQLFTQLQSGERPLVVRTARLEDAGIYLEWANDKAVRASAVQQGEILLSSHLKWFSRKITDPDALLLYFGYGAEGCGQIRYDIIDDSRAFIDISVAPDHRGKGLARKFLALGEQQLKFRRPGVTELEAVVRPENRGSTLTFERSGFVRAGQDIQGDVKLMRYLKAL